MKKGLLKGLDSVCSHISDEKGPLDGVLDGVKSHITGERRPLDNVVGGFTYQRQNGQ